MEPLSADAQATSGALLAPLVIPLGVRHRLANPGMLPLEMIEVQSGAYFGEDDIVRFIDTYGRA